MTEGLQTPENVRAEPNAAPVRKSTKIVDMLIVLHRKKMKWRVCVDVIVCDQEKDFEIEILSQCSSSIALT